MHSVLTFPSSDTYFIYFAKRCHVFSECPQATRNVSHKQKSVAPQALWWQEMLRSTTAGIEDQPGAESALQMFVVGENPKHICPSSMFQDKLCPYVSDSFTCNSLNRHPERVI